MPDATEWTTAAAVHEAMGLSPYDSIDERFLVTCVAAVNGAVAQWRPDLACHDPCNHPMVTHGATSLAVKLYRRRGADPYAGVARAVDGDVETWLGVGRAAAPAVA
jgi:hypothetical protein